MTERWRLLVLAAALNLVAFVGTGAAQTVYVKNAPAASALEIVMGTTTIGTATADARGDAAIPVKLPAAKATDAGIDVHIFIDACDKLRRVLLLERGMEPPTAQAGCDRKEISGFFLVRRVTSLVVDMAVPSIWLRQGEVPPEWLSHDVNAAPASARRPSPTGLVLFGGGGFMKIRDAVAMQCGNVQDCNAKDFRPDFGVGAAFWLTRFLGAEASYVRASSFTAVGSGSTFSFDSAFQVQLFNVMAKVGIPIGPVRFYGNAGADYHRGTFTSNETTQPVTVTVDDTSQTIPGGTISSGMQTQGWGWLFGGGMEGWLTSKVGLFGEVNYAKLSGSVINSTEGAVNDRVTLLLFGLRFHLGR